MVNVWKPEYGRAYRERKRLGIRSTHITTLSWEERLLLKVDASGDCWLWTGALDHSGYGVAKRPGNRSTTAHRDVYEHLVGPVPDHLQVDHLCRVRACVNPDHMQVVTRLENARRTHHYKGPRCKNGHEYTPENTIQTPRRRICRACGNVRSAAWRKRRAAA